MQSECPQISTAHTTCKNYVVIVSKPAHLGDQKHQKTPIKLQFDNPKIKLGYQHVSFAIFRKFQSLQVFPRSIMTYIQVCHQDIFTEFEVHTYLHFSPKSDQKLD